MNETYQFNISDGEDGVGHDLGEAVGAHVVQHQGQLHGQLRVVRDARFLRNILYWN